MGESAAAVVLQGTEQRIGVDLVAGASQEAPTIIVADVVAVRGDSAALVNDVCVRSARL